MTRHLDLPLAAENHANSTSEAPTEILDAQVSAFLTNDETLGIWDCNFVTGETSVSPGWRKMYGFAPDATVGLSETSYLEFMHPDDLKTHGEAICDFGKNMVEELSFEYRHMQSDGRYIWVHSRSKWVEWNEEGKGVRAIGTHTNLSALKTSKETLQEVSHRLELALDASKIGVWTHYFETSQTHWDDMTFSFFGVRPTKDGFVPPETWESMIHPDDRERVISASLKSITEKTDFVEEYRIVHPNGDERFLRCRGGFYLDPQAGPKHIGVNWDITADYRRAEELREANELAESRNEALEIARQNMEFMSLHDSLTELPNRRHLDKTIADSNADSVWKKVALLHIDLDRFKQINDTQGHAAGDAILNRVAAILLEEVGEDGTVARIGGDEFVIFLVQNTLPSQLKVLADNIISKTSEPIVFDGHEIRSGVSIGIAVHQGREINAKKLLIDADIALYRAKNEGRARCEFFSEQLQKKIHAQKKLADEMLRGLERNEFFNVYQPQIDARTHKICGVEALVRWHHPVRGVIPPYQFMPTAEEIDVVAQLDRMVLEQAIGDLRAWKAGNLPVDHVSVNVSSKRLRDPNLINSLRGLDFKPSEVSFELLESIFLEDGDEMVSWNIDQLKDMGIGIDVDDFGTGHASIVALLQLRPNRMKIDMQLIKPIVESERQANLVRSIVEIGKSQGIQVVAEGVETMDHARLLRDIGCDVLQGFVFARPMNAEEVVYYVADQIDQIAS